MIVFTTEFFVPQSPQQLQLFSLTCMSFLNEDCSIHFKNQIIGKIQLNMNKLITTQHKGKLLTNMDKHTHIDALNKNKYYILQKLKRKSCYNMGRTL